MVGWLTGWRHRKRCTVSGCTGAGSNYQFPLTVYYGVGTDSGTSVYLDGLCQLDFGDVRFTASDGETLLSYWVKSQTDGTSALIWVKDSDSLETDNTIYLYYDNPVECASLSSQTDTFVDVISGVVGAWNMEDTAGDAVTDSSGNANNGTAVGTTIVNSPFFAGKKARNINGAAIILPDSALWAYGNNPFAICMRVRFAAVLGAIQSLFEQYISADNRLQLRVGAGGVGTIIRLSSGGVSLINDNAGPNLVQDTNYLITLFRSGDTWKTYVDTTLAINHVHAVAVPDFAATLKVGFDGFFSTFVNGVYENLFISSGITAANISNLLSNYGDATLEAGKVLVRKYVYPEPAPSSWGEAAITEAPVFINARTQWIRDYRKRHLPEMKLLTGLLEFYKTQREENKN